MFYPENIAQRKWFEFYSEYFNSLELNATFYRFPRVEHLKSWYDRSPVDFSFTVKAPRHITHFKKFKDGHQMLNDFYQSVKDGLREKLGCVLFQFPVKYKYDPDRLQKIVDMLDVSVKNVLEFRDDSWWNTEVYDLLEKNLISFCGMSHPALPEDAVGTSDILYYRLHGVPHLYTSKYDVHILEYIVRGLLAHKQATKAFVYFNNTAGGNAIINAKQLQEICELVH